MVNIGCWSIVYDDIDDDDYYVHDDIMIDGNDDAGCCDHDGKNVDGWMLMVILKEFC